MRWSFPLTSNYTGQNYQGKNSRAPAGTRHTRYVRMAAQLQCFGAQDIGIQVVGEKLPVIGHLPHHVQLALALVLERR